MEAIAGITAIGSLASGFIHFCEIISRTIRNIRFAKKEMLKLRGELELFSVLLRRFSKCLSKASNVDEDLAEEIRGAEGETFGLFRRLEKALASVPTIARDLGHAMLPSRGMNPSMFFYCPHYHQRTCSGHGALADHSSIHTQPPLD